MTLNKGDLAAMFLPQNSKRKGLVDLEQGGHKGPDIKEDKGVALSGGVSSPVFENMEVEGGTAHQLIPVIFSHGLSSNRTMHSGLCRDLASHGYIVFAPDHMDQTSSYYETADGEGHYYCNKRDSHDMEYRKGQLEMRVAEARALIEELADEYTRRDILRVKLRFPEGVNLDMSKLIMTGHSFGGMTAIETSHQEPTRVKVCLTLDPWLFTMHQEIIEHKKEYTIRQPFQAVSTDEFHPTCENWFQSAKTMQSLLEYSCVDPRYEHVIVRNSFHLHQCDMIVIAPMEIFLLTKRKPQLTTKETYLLMSELWLKFLDKIDFKTRDVSFKDVDEFLAKMEPQWILYDKKYDNATCPRLVRSASQQRKPSAQQPVVQYVPPSISTPEEILIEIPGVVESEEVEGDCNEGRAGAAPHSSKERPRLMQALEIE
jgi:pimeloyl-ACP methyl ester carboxylesterase